MLMPAAKRRVELLLACLLTLPLLHACGGSSSNCQESDEPYTRAQSTEPLRVPEGMTRPEVTGGLSIPAGQPTDQQSMARASCLPEPPSYFRSAGAIARTPEEVVATWAQSWANREADAVLSLYSTTFKPPVENTTSKEWLGQRREQVVSGPLPDRMVEKLKIVPEGTDNRIATFVQRFGANSLTKELVLVREAGSWRIAQEKVSDSSQ
jgi:hypothetical protein